MYIVPGKPFYIFIENLVGKPVVLSKIRVLAFTSKSIPCVIHVREDEPNTSTQVAPVSVQLHKSSTNTILNIGGFKLVKHNDEQLN